jgi:hypothetical protein
MIPHTSSPLVIRTDFEDDRRWNGVWDAIRAPVPGPGGATFYAYVEKLEDRAFAGATPEKLLASLPEHYRHSFLVVADRRTMSQPDHRLLIVDVRRERGRTFRALPTTVQSIENNLSISNMDFFEFANAAGPDGIFRGFRPPGRR